MAVNSTTQIFQLYNNPTQAPNVYKNWNQFCELYNNPIEQ